MLDFMVLDGELTTAGYIVTIAVGVIALSLASYLAGRKSTGFSVKKIAFCAMCLALGFVLSYVKLWPMPWGGSVTLLSMLPIVLAGYWFGPATGILIGFVHGLLQFIQEPYVLSFFQVCCDYTLAFSALGLGGFFRNQKNGLITGYIVAVLARGAFHTLGGYLYWMDYMPESFPKSLSAIYPICYNYAYILPEAAMTVIILLIPAVKKAIGMVTTEARKN